MAENSFDSEIQESSSVKSESEAVCIDANRVYDSCGDKDCLSDLRVYFSENGQSIVNNAVSVRIRDAQVINVLIDLEPVPFHRGFYSIDMTFFFDITLDAFMAPGGMPASVNGLSVFEKKCILYGSEGNVQVFSSDFTLDENDGQLTPKRNLPRATVQVAKPIALSARLKESCAPCSPPRRVPDCVCRYFGSDFTQTGGKSVFATIGMFTIVQIERNVQLLVESYDFCIPEKECVTSSDNPCEMFSRLDFPTEEFFPPKVTDIGEESGSCCCRKHRG